MIVKTMLEWQQEIGRWQTATFALRGPAAVRGKARHLKKEVLELAAALARVRHKPPLTSAEYLELADCFILLAGIAESLKIDLDAAVAEKMAINRQRKWGKADKHGICKHVSEGGR